MTHEPTDAAPREGFVAVIPAGGVGSRLWPLSRPDRPKFLLDLFGTGDSLLQDTVRRLEPIATHTLVVTGQAHVRAVHAQLPGVPSANLLAEPSPRDSMAAIALAAAVAQHRWGPVVMGSFAADHLIREPELFRATVATAIAAARTGKVVTIGIAPTEPSPAYGYIRGGAALEGVPAAVHVKAFVEKPDVATAAEYLAEGSYSWNAGMFVVRSDVLLGHLERLQPTLYQGAMALAAAWDSDAQVETVEAVWPSLTKISIDHAIAEPVAAEGGVAMVPGTFDWHDVGDFDAVATLVEPGVGGVTSIGRNAAVGEVDAHGTVVVGGTKPIVVIGLSDVVVVDGDEAILVLARSAAQRVKDAAASLP